MSVNKMRLRSTIIGDIFTLDLAGTGSASNYILKAATGLDLDDVSAVGYGSSSTGVKFFTMSQNTRTIVLKIGLNPSYSEGETFQEMREKIYKAVAGGRNPLVNFDLMDGSTIKSTIQGTISKVESDIFTNSPSVQVTLTCPSPLFSAPEPIEVDVESLPSGTIEIVMTDGTAPTGFEAEVTFTHALASFGLSSADNEWQFVIVYNFLVGDVLFLSCDPENLDLYVTRHNYTLDIDEEIRLADRVTATSLWPLLFPGANTFDIIGTTDYYILDSVSYVPKYWGL